MYWWHLDTKSYGRYLGHKMRKSTKFRSTFRSEVNLEKIFKLVGFLSEKKNCFTKLGMKYQVDNAHQTESNQVIFHVLCNCVVRFWLPSIQRIPHIFLVHVSVAQICWAAWCLRTKRNDWVLWPEGDLSPPFYNLMLICRG